MRHLVAVLAAALAAACSNPPSAPAAAPKAAEAAVPFEGPRPTAALSGVVLEKLVSGPYTLLRLKTGEGEVWAAVPRTEREVGAQVTVVEPLPVKRFESKPLRRTFDLVYVGNLG